MARRRAVSSTSRPRAIKVTYYDPAAHQSVSHTVSPGANDLADVASSGYEALRRRWTTTDINDGRHRRR